MAFWMVAFWMGVGVGRCVAIRWWLLFVGCCCCGCVTAEFGFSNEVGFLEFALGDSREGYVVHREPVIERRFTLNSRCS